MNNQPSTNSPGAIQTPAGQTNVPEAVTQELTTASPTTSEKSSAPPASRRWGGRGGILTLSILLLLGGGIILRRSSVGTNLREATQAEVIEALTVPVTRAPLAIRVEGNGTVMSKDTVNLSPKTTGRLAALYVQQGDRVEAGQVVARMDVGSLAAEYQQREAQLAQAEADYARILAGNREEDVRQAEARLVSAQSQVDLTATRLARFEALADQGGHFPKRVGPICERIPKCRG